MNPLLIGQAQDLPNIRPDIQRMIDNPGLWIITDSNQPACEIPIVSMHGKLYAITLAQELDPTRFLPTAVVDGGPYRANSTSQAIGLN